ncbi:Molecular chaperone (small heat shock protein) [gamma proteobacterium IMCC1989]|nr:Molecular chaperone (small heat shock protein) [gamma proteobacterium IMCC1989]
MTRIDLTPLYRSSVGFDRFGSLLDAAFQTEKTTGGYPPYNIEALEENRYGITLAVAGFKESDIEIETENGVLTVRGNQEQEDDRNYLHQGIARRAFERKFTLADHVEVTEAQLADGLLNITLVREIPEAMKPKSIVINGNNTSTLEHKTSKVKAA